MFRPRHRARLGLAALWIVLAAAAAHAQSYPTHVIRIIAPFAPGGLNDTAARLIQPYLEKALGQTVVVENRTGASGIVGSEFVAKAAPDGHTLLMVASSYTVLPATTAALPYDSERDLTPIARDGQQSAAVHRQSEGARRRRWASSSRWPRPVRASSTMRRRVPRPRRGL